MTRIELEYSRSYSEEVNVFLFNAPEVEQYLVEQHGLFNRTFGGGVTLALSFNYAGGDFLGDRAGEFLGVTIEHDLQDFRGRQAFASIRDELQPFGGLVVYDVRSRNVSRKIAPVDHRPNPCSWDGEVPCEEWGGLSFRGKRYCEKHALRPAMDELIALRSRAMTARDAWNDGADWAITKAEDVDDLPPDYLRQMRRDMKLANPNRTTT